MLLLDELENSNNLTRPHQQQINYNRPVWVIWYEILAKVELKN